jgi:hypothetical protein
MFIYNFIKYSTLCSSHFLQEIDRRYNAIKVNQIHPITFCCDIYHSKIISNIYINIYSEYKKLHNKPNMLKNIIGSYNKYIRKKYRLINDYPYSISCYNDKFIIIL